jgi:dTDP-3-amino-3,4,6-trideoxy-alpha-D-glucose transaminase
VNSRLDELQAAFLRVKLRALPSWNDRRAEIAKRYLEGMADADVQLPAVAPSAVPVWHLFTVRVKDRESFREEIGNAGIETAIHYPKPPFGQTAYASMHLQRMVQSQDWSDKVVSLPLSPWLRDEQIVRLVRAIRAFGR